MIKNEDNDNRSNALDSNSAKGEPGRLITYEESGYDNTSGNTEVKIEKYDSRYITATIRSTETREKDMA